MSKLSVTIVDILGVLVPGAALLVGCLFVPPPLAPIPALTQLLDKPIQLLSNPWVGGSLWLATAYVLGFLLRLVSIPFMSIITKQKWSPKLKIEADALEQIFEDAISNQPLSVTLKNLAKLLSARDPGHYAPYFHFAKRVVRKHPDMWVEAERLEAEIRFAAGLFFPFLLLLIDGVLLRPTAWVLVVIGALGAGIVFFAFPSRRIREVLYNHLLALAILLDPIRRKTTSSEENGEAKSPTSGEHEAPNPRPQADSYAAA